MTHSPLVRVTLIFAFLHLKPTSVVLQQTNSLANLSGRISQINPVQLDNGERVFKGQLDNQTLRTNVSIQEPFNGTVGILQQSENNCGANQILRLQADKANCSNYYEQCLNNETVAGQPNSVWITDNSSVLRSCLSGELFDSIDHICKTILSNSYHCGGYECKEPDGFFPDPKDKDSFISCQDGKPSRKMCEPKGTTFDEKLRECHFKPEQLPISLQLFKAFIWFIKITSQNGPSNSTSNDGYIKTPLDYTIVAVVATLIPSIYLLTVLVVYLECRSFMSGEEIDPFLDDNEYYRYSMPPRRPRLTQDVSIHSFGGVATTRF